MWYSNVYRRHLCDMHIDEWNESFLTEFDAKEYIENLKVAKIQNAMIYLQSHVGLCYYPTKSGKMHNVLIGKEDMIKHLIELCHKNDIKVTGYYSLIHNTREHDVHKDWRMLMHYGESRRAGESERVHLRRYGFCCPNNKEYTDFVYEQIKEMTDYFDCEGYFFDMPFWPHTCYCDSCKKRWRDEVGGEIPVNPQIGSEAYYTLINKKTEWMGQWIQGVTNCVKNINPNLSVEHNFAFGVAGNAEVGTAESVNDACDFVGGDLYGGVLNHSFACKFYKNITKNQPFDYMFSRCKPSLYMHTMTKSFDEMKTEIMLTAAHHGATMVIDAIDPVGTLDKRVYERIGEIFEYHSKYEQYFTGKMIEDVGVYYSIKSRNWVPGEWGSYSSMTASLGASRAMIMKHIPFGVTGPYHNINEYKALIVPMLTKLEENDNNRILEYVKNGGNIYISGADNASLIEELLGCKVTGKTVEKEVYIAPKKGYEQVFYDFNEKYPLLFMGSSPIIEIDNCEVMATLKLAYTNPHEVRFATIHGNPPGIETDIPAVLMKKYGKGNVIWSSVSLESVMEYEGMDIYEYGEIFINLLSKLVDTEKLSFKSDAQDDVEITAFKTDDGITVNTVLLNEKLKASQIEPFEIRIKTEKKPANVILLPDFEDVSFDYQDGYTVFKTRRLDVFDMYKIIN